MENVIILPNVSTILSNNRLPESIKEIKFVKIDNVEERKDTYITNILKNIDQKKLKNTRAGDTTTSYNLTALKEIALKLDMTKSNNRSKIQLLIDIINNLKSAGLLNENLPNIKKILDINK
jgi:hypothetical protein